MSNVNHPNHYNQGMIEVIDAIEDWKLGFNLGNAVKYIARAGIKTSEQIEDLHKARWYLNREISRLDGSLVTTTRMHYENHPVTAQGLTGNRP